MGFSAFCTYYKYLLIKTISGESEEILIWKEAERTNEEMIVFFERETVHLRTSR